MITVSEFRKRLANSGNNNFIALSECSNSQLKLLLDALQSVASLSNKPDVIYTKAIAKLKGTG